MHDLYIAEIHRSGDLHSLLHSQLREKAIEGNAMLRSFDVIQCHQNWYRPTNLNAVCDFLFVLTVCACGLSVQTYSALLMESVRFCRF